MVPDTLVCVYKDSQSPAYSAHDMMNEREVKVSRTKLELCVAFIDFLFVGFLFQAATQGCSL